MKDAYKVILSALNDINKKAYEAVSAPAPNTISVVGRGEVTVGFDPVDPARNSAACASTEKRSVAADYR